MEALALRETRALAVPLGDWLGLGVELVLAVPLRVPTLAVEVGVARLA